MERLKDKVVIVTGGALGLGKAQCVQMAMQGAKVAVTDIKEDEGAGVASMIREEGYQAEFWRLDTSDEDNVESVFKEVNDKFGGLDVLVNNAGISGVDKPTHEISLEDWEKVIKVNVTGVFLCTKHALKYMREKGGGSIINLSSIYGLVGAPDVPPYHASKGAIRLMSKTDANLYAKDNIRVNSVHPGFIWTPMVESFAANKGTDVETFKKQAGELHLLGHMGDPEDVAYGVVYLASDESKFVTGTELVIDGGYTAR